MMTHQLLMNVRNVIVKLAETVILQQKQTFDAAQALDIRLTCENVDEISNTNYPYL